MRLPIHSYHIINFQCRIYYYSFDTGFVSECSTVQSDWYLSSENEGNGGREEWGEWRGGGESRREGGEGHVGIKVYG